MTKIKKAKELIKEHGKDFARDHFNTRLTELMKVYDPNNFQHICEIAGLETALEYIENYKD